MIKWYIEPLQNADKHGYLIMSLTLSRTLWMSDAFTVIPVL